MTGDFYFYSGPILRGACGRSLPAWKVLMDYREYAKKLYDGSQDWVPTENPSIEELTLWAFDCAESLFPNSDNVYDWVEYDGPDS